MTLETLAQQYGVSKERIRQIESGAYRKVAKRVRASSSEAAMAPMLPMLPMASKRARSEGRPVY